MYQRRYTKRKRSGRPESIGIANHGVRRPFLAIAIEVRRLLQQPDQVGATSRYLLDDGHRADDLRQAARPGRLQTQQTDDVDPSTWNGCDRRVR